MDLVEHAIAYAKLGWSVLPMQPDKKVPYIKWKPYQSKIATEDEIRQWFKQFPKARIGIVTGAISNLVVLDFDSMEAIEAWRSQHDLPETIFQNTGKGQHYLYSMNGQNIRNQAGVIENVDVRGEGGLIVVAPSLHKSGKQYQWGKIDPIEDGLNDLAEITPEMVAVLRNTKEAAADQTGGNEPDWVTTAMAGVEKGKRNATMTRLAGYWMRDQQGDKNKVLAILLAVNKNNRPPLPEQEIKKIVDWAESRQGIDELGSELGLGISHIEIIDYPDISKQYRFYVSDIDMPITCEPKDIVDLNRFRVKILTLTNRIAMDMKRHVFFKMMQKAINSAKVIKASPEETDHGFVVQIISDDIKRSYDHPERMIEANAVVFNNKVIVKTKAILNALSYTPLKFLTQKKIGQILRDLKMKRKSVRINGEVHKAWVCDLDHFKEFENSEILEEI